MGPRAAFDLPADLIDGVRRELAATSGELTPSRVAEAVAAQGRLLGDDAVLALHDRLHRDSQGAGVLDDLLARPGVTDVLVNGSDRVYVDAGGGLERTGVSFADDGEVRRLATRLAALAGRRLDDSSPCVDARMPNGVRLHAVLSPVARPGTLLSLRVPAAAALSFDDLCASGTMDAATEDALRAVVAERRSFLVSGGTGAGKTSLLGAMLGLVPGDERIVIVEDSSELRPRHPHVVALEGRPANAEGVGAIDLRALVRQALRMRPDRLVVGEVRGPEVVDLLMALNTGHRGGAGTIHANSARDVLTRIEGLGLLAGLSREAVRAHAASAIDVVVHLERGPQGRRVTEVRELAGAA